MAPSSSSTRGPIRGRVSVMAGRSRFALQALPPEDFPDLNAGELANRFTLSAGDLKGLIEKTRFAISTEETRYYLNGIYLHEVAGGEAAARRRDRRPPPGAGAGAAARRAPRACPASSCRARPCSNWCKLIEGEEGEIEVALSATKIRFYLQRHSC